MTALRRHSDRRRPARRALWSGVAPQRAIVVAIAGLLATATIGVTGAVATPRSGSTKSSGVANTTNTGTANIANTGTAKLASTAEIGTAVQIRNTAVAMGVSREGELGRAALAMLHLDWATLYPGWTIAFLPAKSSYLGMTLVPQRRVEIYVRTDRPLAGTAHDIAHELGHVTDVMYNDDASRARFLAFRGLDPSTSWWTCSGCRDLQVPAGDFAETFALVATARYRFYSEVGPEPGVTALVDFQQSVLPAAVRSGFLPAGSQSAGTPSAPDA